MVCKTLWEDRRAVHVKVEASDSPHAEWELELKFAVNEVVSIRNHDFPVLWTAGCGH